MMKPKHPDDNTWRDPDAQWPYWAIGKADRYMEAGVQLCTKDGRILGNAVVIDVSPSKYLPEKTLVAKCMTDMGNQFTFTERELMEQFYPALSS